MAFPRPVRRRVAPAGDGVPQTFDGQTSASADDTGDNDGVTWASDALFTRIGKRPGGSCDCSSRWTSVTIPAGATIDVATVDWYMYNTANPPNVFTDLAFEAADDPAAPTDKTDFDGRTRTTVVAWDGQDFDVDNWYTTPSLVVPLQEVIDRPGWASGQALQIFWDDDDTVAGNNYYNGRTYDHTTTLAAKIHVEFTA